LWSLVVVVEVELAQMVLGLVVVVPVVLELVLDYL
jgi:hypothetical protein